VDVVRGKRLIVGHELHLVAAEVLLLDMPLVGQRVSLLEVLQPGASTTTSKTRSPRTSSRS
jgi:hypothetical protein